MDIDKYLNQKLIELSSYKSDKVALYQDLYEDVSNGNLKDFFSILHCNFNDLFSFMNDKNTLRFGGHYNADQSRSLQRIIEILFVVQANLKGENSFEIDKEYEIIIKKCKSFLSNSGGSTIPNDFPKINLIETKTIFTLVNSTVVECFRTQFSVNMKFIGEGSYAKVFKYKDPHYGCNFVIKRAKKDLRSDELERFKNEYNDLKTLNSPYIIKAYCFNEEKNEYTMEYANETIMDYIERVNNMLSFDKRRALVIQLLNAFEYIHNEGLLHRDISYQNILISHYKDDSSWVKVSDFGLVKRPESTLTRNGTEVKGAINDYSDLMVVGFENYEIRHETFALTRVIYFILTGRKTEYSREKNNELKKFIIRGISEKEKRFSNIKEMREELTNTVFPSLRGILCDKN